MSAPDRHHATHRTIEAVWRIESARVIAGLTRLTRDVGLAEDLAQEALLAALEQWPQVGVPDNPAAWLTATARRRGIDLFRRNAVAKRKHAELARELEALEQTSPDLESRLDNTISDDLGIPRTGRLWAQQLPGLAVASAGSFRSMLDGPLKDAAARDLHLDLHAHSGGADAMARSLIDGSLSFDDEG